jgi:hypothetical protein
MPRRLALKCDVTRSAFTTAACITNKLFFVPTRSEAICNLMFFCPRLASLSAERPNDFFHRRPKVSGSNEVTTRVSPGGD